MSYTLQFGQIWPYLPSLLAGAWLSLQIAFLAFCGGLLIGTAGAAVLSFGGGIMRRAVRGYVTFFTNTRVVDAGFFHVDWQKPHTIVLNPMVGIIALVVGLALLIAARRPAAP